jgi:branched-chain amino acid transport system substrate-binding protein
MNTAKRLLALMLALCLVFALVACSSSDDSSTGTTTDTETTGSETTTDNTDATDATDAADSTDYVDVEYGTGEGTFKIGFVGPLTGAAASYGVSASQGAKIAVEEINALGGLQIELNVQDDEHNAEKSVNAYNTLLDWGMQALVGPVTSTPAAAVAAEAYSDRVFCVTPSASSLDVIDGKDNFFQVCFTDPNQGKSVATYLEENYGDAAIAVIYNNADNYSTGIYTAFVSAAEEAGLNIVYTGTFTDDSQTDFSVQLTGAQNAGATLIFAPTYYTPASVILTQGNSMGYDFTLFGCDGMDGILGIEGFDTSLAEGMLLLTPFSADLEKNADFVSAYEAAYGVTPDQFAADGYDAVYTIYTALLAAGCTEDMDYAEVCDALIGVITDIQVDGLTGVLSWESTGEVNKDFDVYVVSDGKYLKS